MHYHKVILDTVIEISAEDFLISLAELLKRLAVDRLHIVGDIFDRGDSADKIMELLHRQRRAQLHQVQLSAYA